MFSRESEHSGDEREEEREGRLASMLASIGIAKLESEWRNFQCAIFSKNVNNPHANRKTVDFWFSIFHKNKKLKLAQYADKRSELCPIMPQQLSCRNFAVLLLFTLLITWRLIKRSFHHI